MSARTRFMTSGGISCAAASWPTVRPRHKQRISFMAPNLLRRHRARQVSRHSSRSCTSLPAPLRRLARPLRRQRADMPPRVRHHVGEEWQRDLGETNEHRRVVPIVLGEEEGAWVQLHEDVALADGRELHNEHGIIVAEAREESVIKKEGRHAVGAALDDIRQGEQQASSGENRYSPSLGLSFHAASREDAWYWSANRRLSARKYQLLAITRSIEF